MLDYFAIFSKGGALLWTWQLTALRGSPIEALVRTCLLEERSGESSFSYAPSGSSAYTLKWTFHNGLGLVFVAVYQRALKLLYVDDLLEAVKQEFATSQFKLKQYDYPKFDASFKRILAEAEARADATLRDRSSARGFQGKKGGERQGGSSKKDGQQNGNGDDDSDEADKRHMGRAAGAGLANGKKGAENHGGGNSIAVEKEADGGDGAFDVSKMKGKLAKKKLGGKGAKEADKKKTDKKPKTKEARKWGDSSKEDLLDYSEKFCGEGDGATDVNAVPITDFTKKSRIDVESDEESVDENEDSDESASQSDASQSSKGSAAAKAGTGLLGSFVRTIGLNVMGTNALTAQDIAPALDGLKRKLMERNVAEAVAKLVCESVAKSLEGKKLAGLTGISAAVRAAVESALTRILTPKRSIDILREVQTAKARGRPYTMVFVGVNGVGKSTNLSKVAYWLLQNNIKVMVAACDTFRAGAVEQLKTHCTRLGIPLYERGYEKDPAKVAFEAVKAAERAKCDVLLVDTAGRMQDNEPLMRALSNLIALNEPDLVLFVGEALVGNDAVDQLTKFNQRLLDLSKADKPHAIDGILLTKFDTIDDKVGAAVSMVYTSGAPVVFVGCGQTYVDLRRLNVKSVVRSLLK
eukprot:jgi/Botrbrau1/2454/Bobra.0226s0013.1